MKRGNTTWFPHWRDRGKRTFSWKKQMHWWFQNLNEQKKGLFNFRGSFGSSWEKKWLEYEMCSGLAFRFQVEDDEGQVQISLGLLFMSIYLTFPWLRSPSWLTDVQYGCYIYGWAFRLHLGSDKWGSSSTDPWYYNYHFHILDFLFGKMIYFEESRLQSDTPRSFEFRGRVFQIDSIDISMAHWFRSHLPFSVYCKKIMRMNLKISKPPMRAGKGENSWDCGDDGTYGLTCPYEGPEVTYMNKEQAFEYCCRRYCEGVSKDIHKYGRGSGDIALPDEIGFKYLGFQGQEIL